MAVIQNQGTCIQEAERGRKPDAKVSYYPLRTVLSAVYLGVGPRALLS